MYKIAYAIGIDTHPGTVGSNAFWAKLKKRPKPPQHESL